MRYWVLVLLITSSPAAADPIDDYVACMIGQSAVALQGQAPDKKDGDAAQLTASKVCEEPKMDDQEAEGVSDYVNISVLAIAKEVWGVEK